MKTDPNRDRALPRLSLGQLWAAVLAPFLVTYLASSLLAMSGSAIAMLISMMFLAQYFPQRCNVATYIMMVIAITTMTVIVDAAQQMIFGENPTLIRAGGLVFLAPFIACLAMAMRATAIAASRAREQISAKRGKNPE